jgi:multiple sugar transport system permease protein
MATASEASAGALPAVAKEKARRPEDQRIHLRNLLLYTILILYGVFSLAPFLFALISSFKTYQDILTVPPSIIPAHGYTLSNYQTIFRGVSSQIGADFPRYILNSLIYAVGVAILNILLGAMAGYAFGRMQFPGQNVLFALTLAVLMIPGTLIMIPKFLVANALHMTDTYFALLIPAAVTPTSVFLMTQFLKTLPKELEESAMIDGASRFRMFWQVILPLTRPALTTVGLFAFQGAWNDFFWPLLVMSNQKMYTLTVGLSFFKSEFYTQYNMLLAGSIINILPLVALFFAFQRYFIQGISTSGLAGR